MGEAELLQQLVTSGGPWACEEPDGLPHPKPVGKARALQLAADLGAQLVRVGHGVEPEHANLAGVGPAQALKDLDGGGLPGAIGTDQSHDLSGVHVEVESVDDSASAVRLGESTNGDDGVRDRLALGEWHAAIRPGRTPPHIALE